MNEFETMNLQDSYDETSFGGMAHREIRSGGGSRRFLKVRPIDRMGETVDPVTPLQQ